MFKCVYTRYTAERTGAIGELLALLNPASNQVRKLVPRRRFVGTNAIMVEERYSYSMTRGPLFKYMDARSTFIVLKPNPKATTCHLGNGYAVVAHYITVVRFF